MRWICPLLFFLVLPLQAWAWQGLFSLSVSAGGTPLDQVAPGPEYTIQAGDAWGLGVGVLIPVTDTSPTRYEAQISVGYHFSTAQQGDNEIAWRRIPLEGVYYYRNVEQKFRLGWGLIYSVGNDISAKGSNSSAKTDVDNALGWKLAADIVIPHPNTNDDMLSFGLHYNIINYNATSFSREASGNAIGIVLNMFWPESSQ